MSDAHIPDNSSRPGIPIDELRLGRSYVMLDGTADVRLFAIQRDDAGAPVWVSASLGLSTYTVEEPAPDFAARVSHFAERGVGPLAGTIASVETRAPEIVTEGA